MSLLTSAATVEGGDAGVLNKETRNPRRRKRSLFMVSWIPYFLFLPSKFHFFPHRGPGMKPLEPPDSHYLSAAIGWLGLGNVAEAGAELEKIAPQFQSHPDVLAVQFDIHAAAGKWDAAAEIAGTLTRLEPEQPGAWISLAYATRRKTGGGIPQARAILIQAQRTFPKEQIIAYNLACYDCQLGDLDAAKVWLDKACTLGDARKIKHMALQDPDLEPLWSDIRAA
jgi:tetratricopeptide (TPR) repeat protein